MSNNKENPKKQIIFEYYEEDIFKVLAYEHFIQKHIGLGNKIPAKVLRAYYLLLNRPIIERNKLKEQVLQNAKKLLLNDILEYKQNFSFTAKMIKPHDLSEMDWGAIFNRESIKKEPIKKETEYYSIVLSSETFVNEYFDYLMNTMTLEDGYLGNTKNIIDDATRRIYFYIHKGENQDENCFPTDYKLTVIIGLILVSFGLLHDKKTWEKSESNYPLYTTYLNKSVKHLFDKAIADIKKKTKK